MEYLAQKAQFDRCDDTAAERCLNMLKNGDRTALDELYEMTAPSIYAYALSMLRKRHDAEDVMHDTFVRVCVCAHQYSAKGKPLAWMITIAKNLCLMKMRENKRLYQIESDNEDWDMLLADDPSIEPEQRMLLKNSLCLLEDGERSIVVLHAVAGFKHREIAEIMEMPLMSVISKYRRALKKLRESMAEKEEKNEK